MNRQELLDSLRATEAGLYSASIQNRLLARPEEDRAAFVQMRQSIARLVNDISTRELAALNQALAAQEGTLRAALAELQAALQDASDHKATLRRVTTAVGIIAGVAGGVGGSLLR